MQAQFLAQHKIYEKSLGKRCFNVKKNIKHVYFFSVKYADINLDVILIFVLYQTFRPKFNSGGKVLNSPTLLL